jgi:hypothetical protein
MFVFNLSTQHTLVFLAIMLVSPRLEFVHCPAAAAVRPADKSLLSTRPCDFPKQSNRFSRLLLVADETRNRRRMTVKNAERRGTVSVLGILIAG